MNIKIKTLHLRLFQKNHPDKEDLEGLIRYQDDSRVQKYSIVGCSDKELDDLVALTEKDDLGWAIERQVGTYRAVLANPGGKTIKRIAELETALIGFLKGATNHWLFEKDDDGVYDPAFITGIRYYPRDRRNDVAEHVTMTLDYMYRGDKRTDSLIWYKQDLDGGATVPALLARRDWYLPTADTLKRYEESMVRYRALQPQVGQQFLAKGDGWLINDRWSSKQTAMVQEGVPDKLVMDDLHEEGEEFGKDSAIVGNDLWVKDKDDDEEGGQVVLPTLPYLKLFDLDRHAFVILHVDQLKPYVWQPELGDKLILPAGHKEVIQILMDTASEEMDDIIRGKSGGTICICTGEPGTGKTLTAEVTSEVIKRPLYKVNCSQLGTDEEAIEKELSVVLNRASRWNCLLLIDESDVYVRARDNDIQQNAIVGVFLRVLEYYRGVLFLTSNRATVIDDAIMSRATAHLKYEKPTEQALKGIWRVLSTQFGQQFHTTFVDELVATFPNIVGRDVKNLLKLAIRYNRRKGGKLSIDVFKKLAVFKDIECGK